MLPTREEAGELLRDAEKSNPGMWVKHSLVVAECAQKIAGMCNMNIEKAFLLGLLHDIGRKFGVSHFRHVVDGYRYLLDLGYDESARICLTHSFPTQCMEDYVGSIDVSQSDYFAIKQKLEALKLDDYDRLIQLCDCLAGTTVVNMEDRMNDVEQRYGYYPENKRIANRKLKSYFEKLAHQNIYVIVSDDERLWRA